jgi:Multimeric flavodoxin WrbA
MLTVVKLGMNIKDGTERIDQILERPIFGSDFEEVSSVEEFQEKFPGVGSDQLRRVLFVVCLPPSGVCLECQALIAYLVENRDSMKNTVGGVIIDGKGELFTRSLARQLVFAANFAGCTFPGRSLVEGTGSLYNFNTLSKVTGVKNLEAYKDSVKKLIEKVRNFAMPDSEKPKVLVIHASSRATSNTLLLWEKVKNKIEGKTEITEISLRNGSVVDCRGCSYETCLHYGEKDDCVYGGVMVQKVYPAIIKCDVLVMICPNYNDAVSANITAFINRLTAVFRTNDFSKKRVFALVVSGYSGGDIVSEQIIGAMNFNKNFILPGHFAIVETANDPGSIEDCEGIEEEAEELAKNIIA